MISGTEPVHRVKPAAINFDLFDNSKAKDHVK
jgi:hypothetical protein